VLLNTTPLSENNIEQYIAAMHEAAGLRQVQGMLQPSVLLRVVPRVAQHTNLAMGSC
jgi:hypothetical protein